MNEPLQKWYGEWLTEHEGTNLIFANPKDPQLHQVHFVRDTLAYLLWADKYYDNLPDVTYYDPSYYGGGERAVKDLVRVVGEHHSKSVRLPVFSIHRPDKGLQVVMRYNFHDWNVSVKSERPIELDVRGYAAEFSKSDRERYPNGYDGKGYWGYLYFQGFPDEFYFGPYSENKSQFSLSPGSDYELYSFVRELSYKVIRP